MGQADDPSEASILRRIYNSLEEQVGGPCDLFSHPSNVSFQNRLLVFGMKQVDQEAWLPVMTTIMHFLTNRMMYNQGRNMATRMIVDETQVVCMQKSSADILLKAVTTYRKFGGICTLIFQNLSRVLENPELRDMLSNCGYKCIFDQGGVDAAALREIQELSDVEYQSLAEPVPGYCLMIWGTKTILLDARMSGENTLYKMFSTNFHEKKERGQETGDLPARDGTLEAEILRIAQVVPWVRKNCRSCFPVRQWSWELPFAGCAGRKNWKSSRLPGNCSTVPGKGTEYEGAGERGREGYRLRDAAAAARRRACALQRAGLGRREERKGRRGRAGISGNRGPDVRKAAGKMEPALRRAKEKTLTKRADREAASDGKCSGSTGREYRAGSTCIQAQQKKKQCCEGVWDQCGRDKGQKTGSGMVYP
ncbi:MAG: hypothetical protein ACLUOI_19155 [Eisenbergiella sp.]